MSGRPAARRKRTQDTLNELAVQLQQLETQEAELEDQQHSLCFRFNILTAWLECLETLSVAGVRAAQQQQQEKQQQQPERAAEQHAGSMYVDAAHQQLLQQQADLLCVLANQSSPRPAPSTFCTNSPKSLQQQCEQQQQEADPMQQHISPPHDPLAYFRDLASRPLPAGIQDMTALQYTQQHRDLALQLGVQLQLLQNPAAPNNPQVFERIKQMLDSHYHVMLSLVLIGKLDVAEAPKMYNLELMQPFTPNSAEVNNQECIQTTVLPALQLTEAQEDAIAYAVELCESLMRPINRELAELQQQLDTYINASRNSSNSSSSSGSGSGDGDDGTGGRRSSDSADVSSQPPPIHTAGCAECSGGGGGGAGIPQAAAAAAATPATSTTGPSSLSANEARDMQQKLLFRLKVVLRKQYHVTAATTSIFVSTLSWLQAAKMVVYRWPYAATMQYCAKAVAEQQKKKRKQQQQKGVGGEQQQGVPALQDTTTNPSSQNQA